MSIVEVETTDIASPELFHDGNNVLKDAYIDLYESNLDYGSDCDIIGELVHTIRSYDNMRRRSILNTLILYGGSSR